MILALAEAVEEMIVQDGCLEKGVFSVSKSLPIVEYCIPNAVWVAEYFNVSFL